LFITFADIHKMKNFSYDIIHLSSGKIYAPGTIFGTTTTTTIR